MPMIKDSLRSIILSTLDEDTKAGLMMCKKSSWEQIQFLNPNQGNDKCLRMATCPMKFF